MDPSRSGAGSDAELVRRALEGDSEGFRSLVERYWALMVGLALCQVKNPAEAEDIAQEAFIQAHTKLRCLRKPSAFSGWLARIVRNLAADYLRQRVRERVVSLHDLPEISSEAPPLMSANPGLSETQCRFVREAVARLPEKFQTVVLMRFVSDFSAQEIASRLGQQPMTVRVWLHRALKRLRKDLAAFRKEMQES
jgi:RNA polymerase sigma-70 factor, ECF subfamily